MTEHNKDLSDRWQWISEILADALQIDDGDAREAFLRERCGADAEALRELQSLLAADESLGSVIDSSASASGASAFIAQSADAALETESATAWVGKRLGAYAIVSVIAVGGMGAVYKAKRADEAYETLVAIKLMREDLGATTAARVLARFRAERQMLASLNHPNITRLIDAGSTNEGLPYFVMEYVDGEPIDRYCETHGLSIAERLDKFRDVCSAIHFAHQRLIVHRDLKPSNILIDRSGVVKLLDFGIARLLDPEAEALQRESGAAAVTTMLALTPAYASPEQVKSEIITTASDVYSLGVVLYRMLTGRSPYKATQRQSLELAREIVETDPQRPSTAITRPDAAQQDNTALTDGKVVSGKRLDIARLRRELQGDLDNIVLMSLRKDPGLRYASVEQFSQDVKRHLDGQPVIAHADSLAYRAKKFVQRNHWSVGFASLAALGLIAGTLATSYQARVATAALERAETERLRAEKHFASVRKLANSHLFEVFSLLRDVPGTLPANRFLATTSLEYLNSLAADPRADVGLLVEIGNGYRQLGAMQAVGLADPVAATLSLNKAVEFASRAVSESPSDSSTVSVLIASLTGAARHDEHQQRPDDARERFRLAVALADSQLHRQTDVALQLEVANAFVMHGSSNAVDDDSGVRQIELINKGRAIYEGINREALREQLQNALDDQLATTYAVLGDRESRREKDPDIELAIRFAKKGLEMHLKRLARTPNDVRSLNSTAAAQAMVGRLHAENNNFSKALEFATKARETMITLTKVDPLRPAGPLRVSFMTVFLAETERQAGNPRGVLKHLAVAEREYSQLPEASRLTRQGRTIALVIPSEDARARMLLANDRSTSIVERRRLLEQARASFRMAANLAEKNQDLLLGDDKGHVAEMREGEARATQSLANLR
jgi:eukaryotic-like serine/threonine-protein kinase